MIFIFLLRACISSREICCPTNAARNNIHNNPNEYKTEMLKHFNAVVVYDDTTRLRIIVILWTQFKMLCRDNVNNTNGFNDVPGCDVNLTFP